MNNPVTIEELRELREKMIREQMKEPDYEKLSELFPDVKTEDTKVEGSSQESVAQEALQLTKINPNAPSLLDKKAGFSNVIYLAVMSLVTEIVFLAIAFFIYQ